MGANARMGKRGDGSASKHRKVFGAYGRDDLNNNGERLMPFAGDDELSTALDHTFFSCEQLCQ